MESGRFTAAACDEEKSDFFCSLSFAEFSFLTGDHAQSARPYLFDKSSSGEIWAMIELRNQHQHSRTGPDQESPSGLA
jgi:hypothetical protein